LSSGFDLEHLAWLSRIRLSEEEREAIRRRLEAARRLVDRLLEAPIGDVEPLYHPSDEEGLLREDEPRPGLPRELALMNAARTEKGFIVGPRTLEEG